ncbi:enoyl-CoA hydratase-related protein, partial [Pseudomonas sp. Sample_24]
EVQIGMTMHHAGIEIARDRLSKAALQRSVVNGEMFNPQTAVDAGFLDVVVAAEELQGVALAAARQLKKINMTAHKNTKLKVRKSLLEALDNAIIQDQEHLG